MKRTLTGATMLLTLSAYSLYAQAPGNVVGTVTDSGGGVVAGVTVTVVNDGTKFTRVTTTNSAGQYVADSFPTGNITVTAEHPGFEKLVRSGMQLTAADTITVNLQLQVGNIQQSVSVSAEAALVQSQTATVSKLVDSVETMQMPLNERNFTNLLQLSAGASPSTPGMAEALTGYTMNGAVAIVVNGGYSNANAYLIDGLYDRQLWTDYLIMAPPIEDIQEVRVMGSDYSAQYGNSAGMVTIVMTKSGTNQLHGTVFEYVRNADTDANTFFNNSAGKIRPPYRRNEFGAAVGGPIRKDKTFFFGDYQGIRLAQTATEVDTVPSLAQQQMVQTGNFSGLSATVYNPYATTTAANGTVSRVPFAGNLIPASMLDPAVHLADQLYPNPTSLASANNFIYDPVGTKRDDELDARIDQNLGQSDRLFLKFSYDNILAYNTASMPTNPVVPPGVIVTKYIYSGGGGGVATDDNWSVTGNYTKMIGPTMVAEIHFGAVRDFLNIFNFDGHIATAASLGIPNINVSNYNQGIPGLSLSGFTELGDTNTYPEFTHQLSIPVEGIVTKVKGNHTIKFGGGYTRHRLDGHTTLAPRGLFSYTGAFTRQVGGTSAATALADFALGASVSVTNSELYGDFGERMWDAAMFAEDVWRATNRLTITYGLRYEFQAFPYDTFNRWSNISVTTGLFAVAGTSTQNVNGNCGRSLVCLDKTDFDPRLGIAYQLTKDGKTVFRGGYGESHFRTDNVGRTLNLNPPMDVIYATAFDQNSAPPTTLIQGVPPLVQPNLSNPAALTGLYEAEPSNMKNAVTLQMSGGIQREVTRGLLLDVAYVRTITDHLIQAMVANQAVPGPGAYGPRRPLYTVNPALAEIDYRPGMGQGKYNGLQTKVTKRYGHGLSGSLAFTWSKNMADFSRPQNSLCFRCEWGDTADNRDLMLVINHVYELPFGRGRHFATKGPLSYIVGNWDITGIWTKYTGLHFTPSVASSVSNSLPAGVTGTLAPTERPNLNGIPNLPTGQQTVSHWFNVAAFSEPAQYTWGTAGNDILVGPAYFNLDLGIHRNFRVSERVRLQFRGEMFNTFNHANFSTPNAVIGSSSAGTISSTLPARVMQGGLKLVF
ncbi:MAG: TonB-dependent receptor [Bryobacteraceae bacterium]